MKRLILAVCCIGLLSACKAQHGEQFQQIAPSRIAYEIVIVDGCEYIHLDISYSGFTHKGNCKNPEHKSR